VSNLRRDGKSQQVLPDVLQRVQERGEKIRAADPLHRAVTFNQALTWMLDKIDKLDKEGNRDA
jgi:hypothetical protein